jgi:hypothetical protein
MVHRHEAILLDHAMHFRQIPLRESLTFRSVNGTKGIGTQKSYHFVRMLANLLSEQLVLPLFRLAFVFGHDSWDDERHGCNFMMDVSGDRS